MNPLLAETLNQGKGRPADGPAFRRLRALRLVLLCGVAGFCGLLCKPLSAQGDAGASAPSPGGEITGGSSVSDNLVRFYQAQVQRDPTFWTSYNRLAAAYAQKARETGDISYLQLAEAALEQSLKLESKHAEAAPAWTQMASVHLAEHRFHEAADDAGHAMALEPDNLAAVPYAGDAQYELGDYAAAQGFYDRLTAAGAAEPAADAVEGTARPHPGVAFLAASHGAGLLWVHGDTAGAAAGLQRAIGLAQQLHLPAENQAWVHFMLGEQMFQTGDLAGAEAQEQAALLLFPRYYRALAAMGQVRAAQGQWPAAIDFYRRAIAIVPLPLFAAALGDVYTASGDPAAAQRQYALVEYIGKLSAINREVYNRELAVFYADHDRHLPEALQLAQRELDVRRDVYTLDVLAWCQLKNGDVAHAQGTMAEALRLGTKDALMQYHAGMIAAAAGNAGEARKHLQGALAISPQFHPVFAAAARERLAQLSAAAGAGQGSVADGR